jgi:hypothetical protein
MELKSATRLPPAPPAPNSRVKCLNQHLAITYFTFVSRAFVSYRYRYLRAALARRAPGARGAA